MNSTAYWQQRLGADAVTVYSPFLRRDAVITAKQKALLDVLQIGREVSLMRLLPLTPYRSRSGLWAAARRLDSLGLVQRMIRRGVHLLRARVRTVVTPLKELSENQSSLSTVRTVLASLPIALAITTKPSMPSSRCDDCGCIDDVTLPTCRCFCHVPLDLKAVPRTTLAALGTFKRRRRAER